FLPGPETIHDEGDVASVGQPARPVVHLRRDALTAVQEDERGKGTRAVGFAQAPLHANGLLGGGALEADGTRATDGDEHHDGERAQTRGCSHARKYIAPSCGTIEATARERRNTLQRRSTRRDGVELNESEWPAEAREHFERGYEAQMAGRLDEAIDHYQRSLAVRPTAEAHTFLGGARPYRARQEGPMGECTRPTGVDRSFDNPKTDIGASLIELGRGDEAVGGREPARAPPRYNPRHFPFFNLA